jgi:acetylglutamate kinase
MVCNVNADDAAAGIAAGLGARQLVLLTDVDGIRDASGTKLDSITVAEAEALIADGTIRGGMIPKVKAALAAVAWDDAEAIIADGSVPHALVRSLEDPTFGTRVSAHARAGAPQAAG